VHLQAERILITRRDVADRIAHVAATAPHLLWSAHAAQRRDLAAPLISARVAA